MRGRRRNREGSVRSPRRQDRNLGRRGRLDQLRDSGHTGQHRKSDGRHGRAERGPPLRLRTVDRVRVGDRIRLAFAGPRSRAAGDGGRATDETLGYLYGLAIDPNGRLLAADVNDDRVRSVDPVTGIIQTIAGGGDEAPRGRIPGDGGGPSLRRPASPSTGAATSSSRWPTSSPSTRSRPRPAASRGTPGSAAAATRTTGDGGPATQARLGALQLSRSTARASSTSPAPRVPAPCPARPGRRHHRNVRGRPGESPLRGTAARPSGAALRSLGSRHRSQRRPLHRGAQREPDPEGLGRDHPDRRGEGNGRVLGGRRAGASGPAPLPGASLVGRLRQPLRRRRRNNRVRKISPDGRITTVAGNGTVDIAGDGQPATAAGLRRRARSPSTRRGALRHDPLERAGSAPSSRARPRRRPCPRPPRTAGPSRKGPTRSRSSGRRRPEPSPTTSISTRQSARHGSSPRRPVRHRRPRSRLPAGATNGRSPSRTSSRRRPTSGRSSRRGTRAAPGLPMSPSPISLSRRRGPARPRRLRPLRPGRAARSSRPGERDASPGRQPTAPTSTTSTSARPNPPRLYRRHVAATSLARVTGLEPVHDLLLVRRARYAACDPTKITGVAVATFRTSGPCARSGRPRARPRRPPARPASPRRPCPGRPRRAPRRATTSTSATRRPAPLPGRRRRRPRSTFAGLAPGGDLLLEGRGPLGVRPGEDVATPRRRPSRSRGACTAPPTPVVHLRPAREGRRRADLRRRLARPWPRRRAARYLVERSRSASFSPVLDSHRHAGTVGVLRRRRRAGDLLPPRLGRRRLRPRTRRSPPSADADRRGRRRQARRHLHQAAAGDRRPARGEPRRVAGRRRPRRSGAALHDPEPLDEAGHVIVALNALAASPTFFRVDDPQGRDHRCGLPLQPRRARTLS